MCIKFEKLKQCLDKVKQKLDNKDMKRLLFVFIALLAFLTLPLSVNFSSASDEYTLEAGEAYVIVSKCDIYTEPSFSSEKLKKDDVLVQLRHNETVTIIEVPTGDFAHIEKNDYEGYIYKYYLTQNLSQDALPVFNAKIRNDTKIYDIGMNDSGYIAKKGTRVYIYSGFKSKQEYTPIQIILENGRLYNGYIKTADINPDGVSSLLIVGISIIIAAVTIILSLVFIQKNKKGKKWSFSRKKKANDKAKS